MADLKDRSRKLRVFLCHSSRDKVVVRELAKKLKTDGFDPWLDEDQLLPGQDWNREISNAVRTSDVAIVCLSRESVSRAGYVQKETKFALDVADEQPEGAIYIIPAKLEECDVPERLGRWHWVSLDHSAGYTRLTGALIRRANDLGILGTSSDDIDQSDDEDENDDELYNVSSWIEANKHMVFPCDLTEGQMLKIDLANIGEADVLILDDQDYAAWKRGDEYDVYNEFLDRDHLHAFFKAREDGRYLIVVANDAHRRIFVELLISYA